MLSARFLASFENKVPDLGFNGLGNIVFLRTYARTNHDGHLETWQQCVRRVVEGCFRLRRECIGDKVEMNKERRAAEDMYERIFSMKFLPAGRGLWAMGTDIIDSRRIGAALNSCAFVSTDDENDPVAPFVFLMDLSMLGVGVGFDTKGAGKVHVHSPDLTNQWTYAIRDAREGWVEALEVLLRAFLSRDKTPPAVRPPVPEFDYSAIRAAGVPLTTFGGLSSGPEPLRDMLNQIRAILHDLDGKAVTSRLIVDIMNIIGRCVVAGNVRRTAEIAFGEVGDTDFLDLKNYDANPDRVSWGWVSNNSVFAQLGMDYTDICKRIVDNGEPGICWLENMRAYSRMCERPDWRDERVSGGNPCMEQSLENGEMCNLVETFPARHTSLEDFAETLKCALLYAKTVTLVPSGVINGTRTDAIVARNRRIGCSVSGIAQFLSRRTIEDLRLWLETGYDTIRSADTELSAYMQVPESVKLTSVKPSGTVSLLAGATPGLHYPISRFYIRRVRLSVSNPIIDELRAAGHHLEPCVNTPQTTVIVSIPVDAGEGVRCESDVSFWEQLSLAAFLQRHWADNQVSVTVTFDPDDVKSKDLANALNYHQFNLKAVSFLPMRKGSQGCFPQMPYETIDETTYTQMRKNLRSIDPMASSDHTDEVYCDGDLCVL